MTRSDRHRFIAQLASSRFAMVHERHTDDTPRNDATNTGTMSALECYHRACATLAMLPPELRDTPEREAARLAVGSLS
jgi:hypothetical protein